MGPEAARLGLASTALAAVLLGLATPAAAVAPQRTAWWNEAPLAVEIPPSGVGADQLAVGELAGSPTAMAALAYQLPSGRADVGARLTLPVDTSRSSGTIDVIACPVAPGSTDWRGGGDQSGTPPAFDCSAGRAAPGRVSPSGTTVSFMLPTAAQEPGLGGYFNVAVVPDPVGSGSFQAVFDAPASADFVSAVPAAGQRAPESTPAPAGVPEGGAPAGAAYGGSTATPPEPTGVPGGAVPGMGAPGAYLTPPAEGGAPAPAARAGSAPPGAPVALGTRPSVASASRIGWITSRRQRLVGVWLLVDTGLVLLLFGARQQRQPRLLGSLGSRSVGPAPEPPGPVGGLGRFARPRSGPPRPI